MKYIRHKRRNRNSRGRSMTSSSIGNDSMDEIDRAIQASLETFREEAEKRGELPDLTHDESDEE